MAEWSEDVPTEGSVELPPDPRAMDAMGRNHSLETALADLVDNSIDAGASDVLIRLVRAGGRLTALYVVDNGRGMTPASIDSAMTMGGRREYGAEDLGHFGLGLKAASFSQARSLTVMSRASGSPVVGRRWRLGSGDDRYFCDVVPESFAAGELERGWTIPMSGTGTVVRWDDVVTFPAGTEAGRVESFITTTINTVCQHLGIVFHRFLEDGRLNVAFEVLEAESDIVGAFVEVTPISPFGYSRSGRSDFPKVLTAELGDKKIDFRCHVWPARSSLPQFRLTGNPVDRQGLYFYRRDRLLQAGGWDGIHVTHPKLQLARVEVDIDDHMVDLFRMNPEKSRVLVGHDFAKVGAAARSVDGISFHGYLDIAEQIYRTSQMRKRTRKPMIHPGAGLPPRVRSLIENEVPGIRGEEPIDIRWCQFPDDSFFQIDREEHTLWLNKRYRKMLLGGKHGGLNDLPLLKVLLYLLLEDVFEGERLGPKDKDNIDLWQKLLTTAVQAERT